MSEAEHLYNEAAERAVLGGILLTPAAIEKASVILQGEPSELFYRPAHQHLYQAMLELHKDERPIDALILQERLLLSGRLEDVGGMSYIAEISGVVPTSANVEHYACIVNEYAAKRALIKLSRQIGVEVASGIPVARIESSTRASLERITARQRVVRWPSRLAPEAFYGLPGEFVRLVGPETEADPAALLASFLAACGCALGRESYYEVSATRHAPNLSVALIGATATARKGTSFGPVDSVLGYADEGFRDSIASGLTSGEGLIYHVRDGEPEGDPGVADKRLLVLEEELARALGAGSRQGNTLSAVIRMAWDGKPLRTLAKNSPCRSKGAHIGIVAHCTEDELRETLSAIDARNGFANRILWFCVERSKSLPNGGSLPYSSIAEIGRQLRDAIEFAHSSKRICMTTAASEIWDAVYEDLNNLPTGILGKVVARGPAQVVRVATIYALLDRSTEIDAEHLMAGLAVWEYSSQSAAYLFGDSPKEDREVSRVRRKIQEGGATRTELNELFSGKRRAERIENALSQLGNEVEEVRVETGGRPKTVYQNRNGRE